MSELEAARFSGNYMFDPNEKEAQPAFATNRYHVMHTSDFAADVSECGGGGGGCG
jgi:hypothetical protein